MLIDSHAHLTCDALFPAIESVIKRAKQGNISAVVNICTDPLTLERGRALAKKYPWICNAAATTPHDVEKEGEEVFPIVSAAAKTDQTLIAIGETGLDYYYKHSSPKIQQEFLKRYLELALECELPVIIHCREAFSDLFAILDSFYKVNSKWAPGVLHCFTGTEAEAEEVLKRGWYLSLSGIVTFKKSEALQRVAKLVPLDRLLIETDAPYLAPQGKRGQMNEPSFLQETAAFIASLKGISYDELAKATCENASKLFNLISLNNTLTPARYK